MSTSTITLQGNDNYDTYKQRQVVSVQKCRDFEQEATVLPLDAKHEIVNSESLKE